MEQDTYKEKTTYEEGFLQEYTVLDNGDKGTTDAQFIEGNWELHNHD